MLALLTNVREVRPPECGPDLHHAEIPLGDHLPALRTFTYQIAHIRPKYIPVKINLTTG
jgi:hypothetical protein